MHVCLKNVAACLMVLLLGETFGQLLLDRFAALLAGFHPRGPQRSKIMYEIT